MEVTLYIFFFSTIGFLIFVVISSVTIEKQKNKNAPILQIPVTVVEKRVQTKASSNNNRFSTSNDFKVTFEHIHNGIRHTFTINESDFDQIIEDDIGYLTYQRKRYHSFVRDYNAKHYNSNQDTNISTEDVPLRIE